MSARLYVVILLVAIGHLAEAAVTLTISAPTAGAMSGDTLAIRATVNSPFDVDVIATVSGRSVTLTAGGGGSFSGTLSLVGLTEGSQTLSVTATEHTPGTGVDTKNVAFTYNSEPEVAITLPIQHSVARPIIHVTATCSDSGQPCATIEIGIEDTVNQHPVMTLGPAFDVDVDVSLTAFDPSHTTLYVKGIDAQGAIGIDRRPIHVDSGPLIAEVMSAYGLVLDADADRALYVDGTNVRILHRDHCDNETLGTLASPVFGKLTPRGALVVDGPVPGAGGSLVEWRDGARIDHGTISGTTPILQSAGGFAAWHEKFPSDQILHRLNVSTGLDSIVSTVTGNNEFDVARSGVVAYWTSGPVQVHRWLDGIDTLLGGGSAPSTDGALVAAVKSGSPCTTTLWKADGTEELLSDNADHFCRPETSYKVNAGRVAFTRANTQSVIQVWRRETDGTRAQVTASTTDVFVDALAADGTILLTRPQLHAPWRRELLGAGGTTQFVNSLGSSIPIGNAFLIPIGRTVFAVGSAPPCTTVDCATSCDGGGIRPTGGGGGDAGVDGPPDAPIFFPDAAVDAKPDAFSAPDAAIDAGIRDAPPMPPDATIDGRAVDAPVTPDGSTPDAPPSTPDAAIDAATPDAHTTDAAIDAATPDAHTIDAAPSATDASADDADESLPDAPMAMHPHHGGCSTTTEPSAPLLGLLWLWCARRRISGGGLRGPRRSCCRPL